MSRTSRFTLAGALLGALCSCAPHYTDDRFVAAVRQLAPSTVLLTMKVPPEKKNDPPDEGYASGTVVASGTWGSDILTVQHAVDRAWDVRITVENSVKAPAKIVAQNADLDIALVRTPLAPLRVARLGSSSTLRPQIGREVGILGYPIPDEFTVEGLGPGTSLNVGRLSSVRNGALEVTLPIVPGESGGPIFLGDTGEIIGMAESRFDDERSIGFGLPIDEAKRFLHKYDAAHGL